MVVDSEEDNGENKFEESNAGNQIKIKKMVQEGYDADDTGKQGVNLDENQKNSVNDSFEGLYTLADDDISFGEGTNIVTKENFKVRATDKVQKRM